MRRPRTRRLPLRSTSTDGPHRPSSSTPSCAAAALNDALWRAAGTSTPSPCRSRWKRFTGQTRGDGQVIVGGDVVHAYTESRENATLSRTHTFLGDRYRRLSHRRGKKRASSPSSPASASPFNPPPNSGSGPH
jgi:hypothetical protein